MVLHIAPWLIRHTMPVASAALVVAGSLSQLFLGPELIPSMFMVLLTVQNLAHRAPRWASIAGFLTALGGAVLYAVDVAVMPHFSGPGGYNPGEILDPPGWPVGIVMSIPIIALVLLAWVFGNFRCTCWVRT